MNGCSRPFVLYCCLYDNSRLFRRHTFGRCHFDPTGANTLCGDDPVSSTLFFAAIMREAEAAPGEFAVAATLRDTSAATFCRRVKKIAQKLARALRVSGKKRTLLLPFCSDDGALSGGFCCWLLVARQEGL